MEVDFKSRTRNGSTSLLLEVIGRAKDRDVGLSIQATITNSSTRVKNVAKVTIFSGNELNS